MKLTTKFGAFFSPATKKLGEAYFAQQSNRITFVKRTPTVVRAVLAEVLQEYVRLTASEDDLVVSCSCSSCTPGKPCHHIWALIVASDVFGYLGSATSPNKECAVYLDGAGAYEVGRSFKAPPDLTPDWRYELAQAKKGVDADCNGFSACEINYLVFSRPSPQTGGTSLLVQTFIRRRKINGDWGVGKPIPLSFSEVQKLPEAADRQILTLLSGTAVAPFSLSKSGSRQPADVRLTYALTGHVQPLLLPLLCSTNRCFIERAEDDSSLPLAWDDSDIWTLWLRVERSTGKKAEYSVSGELRKGAQIVTPASKGYVLSDTTLLSDAQIARLGPTVTPEWLELVWDREPLLVPIKDGQRFITELLSMPNVPALDLPEELQFEEVSTVAPRPQLQIRSARRGDYGGWRRAELWYEYDGVKIESTSAARGVYLEPDRRYLLRDLEAEKVFEERLLAAGVRKRFSRHAEGFEFTLAESKAPRVVHLLVKENWRVESDGKLLREPGEVAWEVKTGIDWFELGGTVDFGDAKAKVPELLAALRRGADTVKLNDGTVGVLPEEWVEKFHSLAKLGVDVKGKLRFSRGQAGLLDALLASQPHVDYDATFSAARKELESFEKIRPMDPPSTFQGVLRSYQREGLGWLHFLLRLRLGGCLADDMGLGKTVMTLALLEFRRLAAEASVAGPKGNRAGHGSHGGEKPRTSLVVTITSAVPNWVDEANLFTPGMRVLAHEESGRRKSSEHFKNYDLVIMSHGTLLRDVLFLKDFHFDYVILDEPVKNETTQSAKAVRLLSSRQRLVLCGTPVENNLGELRTIMEFLNPGMLGASNAFKLGKKQPDEETCKLLNKALRPYILRRTKEQVGQHLPPKTVQDLRCELAPTERRRYDELVAHYRESLLKRIDEQGIKRSKVPIFAALLRLRQAACHPGLIDKTRVGESSAKLELLMSQLSSVLTNGHKVLIFSQFTSLLAIVRRMLDEQSMSYVYLDGQSKKRGALKKRFQTDDTCKLFLISLKAGGRALNLTAADYVYLLDPWWNPFAEAQAIDRAHREGQTRHVFGYRLLAANTIEDKILQLQDTKRVLANSVITSDNSVVSSLQRKDIELLLS